MICKLHGCDQEMMVGRINKVSSIYNQGAFLFYFPSPRLSFQSADGDDSVTHEARDTAVVYLPCLNACLALISDRGGDRRRWVASAWLATNSKLYEKKEKSIPID